MLNKLNLDKGLVNACFETARQIAQDVTSFVDVRTTVSIERAVARLIGIDGVDDFDIPLPNVLVDHIVEKGGLANGVSYYLGNAILQTGKEPQRIAEMVSRGEIDLIALPRSSESNVRREMKELCLAGLAKIVAIKEARHDHRRQHGGQLPMIYVVIATGDVYEDVRHAEAAANYGADIIAVIRSTAQSLLDYVPYGPTTEGYGGTFATQMNFRIMRAALDDWFEKNGRYVRLSSFSSGLCMPEIALIGALEGLDNMVNDALYGILYRDINIGRTLVDQKISRMLTGFSGLVINTGEDNYLRTADAVRAAPSVVASHLINYHLALDAGLAEDQIGLGHSFEIDPSFPNSYLYEWAQAQLIRELFPHCPIKYMPPTRHMNGNLFRTHACDTLFNLAGISTHQGILLVGVPTEGIHTPHIQDRILGLENVRYVFDSARSLGDEIYFRPDGIVQSRAKEVLLSANEILEKIKETGLFAAIEGGIFGDVQRGAEDGRGKEGVILKGESYFNPLAELIQGDNSWM